MLVRFADGSRAQVTGPLGDLLAGKDADGDLLVPLLKDHPDGPLVPLTPCCYATGKGGTDGARIVCRGCFQPVDDKYGSTEVVDVPVAKDARYVCGDPDCRREHTPDGGALPSSHDTTFRKWY
jgi:hypothetical protein